MIAEDFGPVCTRGQKTREGAASAVRHRHDHRHRGQTSETRFLTPAQSAIGTIIDIAVKLVKPKSFLTTDKRLW